MENELRFNNTRGTYEITDGAVVEEGKFNNAGVEFWKKRGEEADQATRGGPADGQCVQCVEWQLEVKMKKDLEWWQNVGLSLGIGVSKGPVSAGASITWNPWKPENLGLAYLRGRICADGKKVGEIKGMRGVSKLEWTFSILPGTFYYRYVAYFEVK